MKKKSSASSQPERLVRVRSEDIFNKPPTKSQQKRMEAIAARQVAGDDSQINFDEIPPLTDEQLARMVRTRDLPPRKVPVSVRLDPAVLAWLKGKGEGHLTRINDILANVMEAELGR
jgi:uncharacterized protein (DUF4415 family)